jgi:hypothetical protein
MPAGMALLRQLQQDREAVLQQAKRFPLVLFFQLLKSPA